MNLLKIICGHYIQFYIEQYTVNRTRDIFHLTLKLSQHIWLIGTNRDNNQSRTFLHWVWKP